MKPFIAIAIILSILGAESFTLKSDTIGGKLLKKQEFSGFGCDGQNISPELHWIGAPKKTKGFAVTIFDPDAPNGRGWWHWIVCNIPPNTTSLPEDFGNIAKPSSLKVTQGKTDYGTIGYGGACPPKGDRPHRYVFTVYALDIDHLDVDANTSPILIESMIHSHLIAKATLTSYYGR